MENKNNISHEYREIWQNNVQIIESLTNSIEKNIFKLEKNTHNFNNTFDAIKSKLETLSNIYSNFNNIEGSNYILKLNSLIKEIEDKIKNTNTGLDTVYFILNKVKEVQQDSFTHFPFFKHSFLKQEDTRPSEKDQAKTEIINRKNFPFKWLTFSRNNSLFITRYKNVKIIPFKSAKFDKNFESPLEKIIFNHKKYTVKDLFLRKMDKYHNPVYYIIVNGEKCFAVDKIKCRYFGKKNIFVNSYSKLKSQNSLIKGRVRLKGEYYYFLKIKN